MRHIGMRRNGAAGRLGRVPLPHHCYGAGIVSIVSYAIFSKRRDELRWQQAWLNRRAHRQLGQPNRNSCPMLILGDASNAISQQPRLIVRDSLSVIRVTTSPFVAGCHTNRDAFQGRRKVSLYSLDL